MRRLRDPGRYRAKVWYQTPVEAVDEDGGAITTWVDAFSFRALIRPYRGAEVVRADRATPETTLEVTCRYRPEIGPSGRLRVEGGGGVLEISSALDFEQRRIELTLTCHRVD